MKVSDAICSLVGALASITHLDPEREIELDLGLTIAQPRKAIMHEVALIWGIEDTDEDDIIHFLYEKSEDQHEDDILGHLEDNIRVGHVIKHDHKRRMTLIQDYANNHPKWFKWDKACRAYILKEVL